MEKQMLEKKENIIFPRQHERWKNQKENGIWVGGRVQHCERNLGRGRQLGRGARSVGFSISARPLIQLRAVTLAYCLGVRTCTRWRILLGQWTVEKEIGTLCSRTGCTPTCPALKKNGVQDLNSALPPSHVPGPQKERSLGLELDWLVPNHID